MHTAFLGKGYVLSTPRNCLKPIEKHVFDSKNTGLQSVTHAPSFSLALSLSLSLTLSLSIYIYKYIHTYAAKGGYIGMQALGFRGQKSKV